MPCSRRMHCACVLTALLSACGGSGSSSNPSDPPSAGQNQPPPPAQNQPPVAKGFALSTDVDTQIQSWFDATDPDGDQLTATVVSPPAKGAVSISSSSRMMFTYTPRAGQSGGDTFTYVVTDGSTSSAAATVTITLVTRQPDPPVAQLSYGVVFGSDQGSPGVEQLFFADGSQSFKVSAPLAADEALNSWYPAVAAPLVFYTTKLSETAYRLYRVDLRQPGVARKIADTMQYSYDYAISDDGSKVAYRANGRMYFWDLASSGPARDLGAADGDNPLIMNVSGTRVFYSSVAFTLDRPSALYSIDLTGSMSPVQITPTLSPPEQTGNVVYLTRDEQRLYYVTFDVSLGKRRYWSMNPDAPGSRSLVHDGATGEFNFYGVTRDESTFWGSGQGVGGALDFYALKIGAPGTLINLTQDTATQGPITREFESVAMSDDGTRFYYIRPAADGHTGTLYRVDTAVPAVSAPIGGSQSAYYGINSFSLARSGRSLVYSTLDTVPSSGGSQTPGLSAVLYLDLERPGTAVPVQQFNGPAIVWKRAPDDSFAVVISSETPGPALAFLTDDIYLVRDPSQQAIQLDSGKARLPFIAVSP